MKLAVISHTEHFLNEQGQVVGWGPTVRELNHLLDIFDEIYHIAVLHQSAAPPNAIPYQSDKIRFIPLQPFGGPGLSDKLRVLWQAPAVINTVREVLRQADWWQFRAPTGIGVFLIPYLSWFVRKPGWFKYAGNWTHPNPPLGYRWQRFWLARLQKRKVTINGRWPGQPSHCLSFENPCLDEQNRKAGAEILAQKDYAGPLEICFVGRLEAAKGVDRIFEAFKRVDVRSGVNKLHLIGDGPRRSEYEKDAQSISVPVIFHGFLPPEAVAGILAQCQVLLLPSDSEGFPKVVAEAANYGCVSVVSNVSSIPQYINEANGFLWDMDKESFADFFDRISPRFFSLKLRGVQAYKLAGVFTFDHYKQRIVSEILE